MVFGDSFYGHAVFEIYWNKPVTIPSFESIEVKAALLEKYVGVYAADGVPAKFTITREGTTLFAK